MEALALLLVISAFIALLLPEIKDKPPSAGAQLEKGIRAMAKEIHKDLTAGGSKDKKKEGFWASPWSAALLAIALGILFTYIL